MEPTQTSASSSIRVYGGHAEGDLIAPDIEYRSVMQKVLYQTADDDSTGFLPDKKRRLHLICEATDDIDDQCQEVELSPILDSGQSNLLEKDLLRSDSLNDIIEQVFNSGSVGQGATLAAVRITNDAEQTDKRSVTENVDIGQSGLLPEVDNATMEKTTTTSGRGDASTSSGSSTSGLEAASTPAGSTKVTVPAAGSMVEVLTASMGLDETPSTTGSINDIASTGDKASDVIDEDNGAETVCVVHLGQALICGTMPSSTGDVVQGQSTTSGSSAAISDFTTGAETARVVHQEQALVCGDIPPPTNNIGTTSGSSAAT